MSTQKESKLRILSRIAQPGIIVLASWLEKQGISRNLQKHYLKSGWLKPFGRGAYQRPEDEISWQGALCTIQNQTDVRLHAGGLTAISLQGLSHYLRLGEEPIYLFSPHKHRLPKWFSDHSWEATVYHKQTGFLPPDLGLLSHETGQVTMKISSPERAIMECLYLAPQEMDLVECYQIMEGLVNLLPGLVMDLLGQCGSVQVKRLFLFMAEKARHQWFSYINTDNVDLGKGNRSIVTKGVYNSKYKISIPGEISEL